ncbi:hypothetical protein ACJX0J_018952, partial [Zea mays]
LAFLVYLLANFNQWYEIVLHAKLINQFLSGGQKHPVFGLSISWSFDMLASEDGTTPVNLLPLMISDMSKLLPKMFKMFNGAINCASSDWIWHILKGHYLRYSRIDGQITIVHKGKLTSAGFASCHLGPMAGSLDIAKPRILSPRQQQKLLFCFLEMFVQIKTICKP